MTDDERWLPVPGFPGYEVSDMGQVRSWQTWRTPAPRLLSSSRNRFGYVEVALQLDGRRRVRSVHRLVMLAFAGPRPPGLETRHLDGDQLDNARSNLVYGTRPENTLDSVRHGTHRNARKVECPQGHPYDTENGRTYGNGWRQCRACDRERKRALRAAHAVDSRASA